MIKKIFLVILVAILLVSALTWYKFLSPKTAFAGERKYLYIRTSQATKQAVLDSIATDSILSNPSDFEWLAEKMDYWQRIKPGRYQIKQGESVLDIVRKLRNGSHTPVNLVINKLRLPQDLAKLVGKNFEVDSSSVIQWLDSAGTDHFHKIIPNTYSFPWTYSTTRIFKKLNEEYDKWWKEEERLEKAKAKGYTPEQVYTIASIVEEESNNADDKLKIASVYFNRLQRGMPLQADPTIRYALKNFTMNRVYYKDLEVPSPYNTYRNPGLPPGPICTPSPTTIDAVLDAPVTDYLFFVANADLMGGSTFTSNLADHNRAAKIYQDSLSAWLLRKAAKQKAAADSLAKASRS
ncbi:MAG: endolytic transglycosylase MltG [Bacteroidota bacterium]